MRILIKGAGDIATGIACRLFSCGYKIIMTETGIPTTVRRNVAFSKVVYENKGVVEGICAKLANTPLEIENIIKEKNVAVIIDPSMEFKSEYNADIVIDAIIAKRNLGTKIDDAKLVIGIGPGFRAGEDCHCVVESNRGHNLGRLMYTGVAEENTGVPAVVMGYAAERIIRASKGGAFKATVNIGDIVKKGAIVAYSDDSPVFALMDGLIRGMLQDGVLVTENMKCGDIDAKYDINSIHTISDKARAISGAVLEAIVTYTNSRL